MKFLSMRALILVVISSSFLVSVTSCKKSSSGGSSAALSATVSGTAWAPSIPVEAFYIANSQEFGVAGLQLKGGDSVILSVGFPGPITLNQAVSSDTSFLTTVAYEDSKTANDYEGGFSSGHALVTVTSYDATNHKIGGTFSGVLYNLGSGSDSIVITNGSFNTSYIAQ
jgi:hypothetical protein